MLNGFRQFPMLFPMLRLREGKKWQIFSIWFGFGSIYKNAIIIYPHSNRMSGNCRALGKEHGSAEKRVT